MSGSQPDFAAGASRRKWEVSGTAPTRAIGPVGAQDAPAGGEMQKRKKSVCAPRASHWPSSDAALSR